MISLYRQSFLLALVLVSGAGFSAARAAEHGEFTLSLKNTDISSLITTVSKITGRNFVVDPRVKAKVTVISSRPMGAEQLYEVFLSVLQVHGFSAVPSGDVIKIVPDVSAKQGPVPYLGLNNPRDQLVTHVIRIDNVPAAQLVPILRPLVPQQGHLAAYASTNSLVITDRSANIKRLIKIIQRIDRPDNEEIEFVKLLHASSAEVVRILDSLRRTAVGARGAGSPGSIRLAADERTNSILISGDRASRLRMRGLIASLDTPLESGGNTKVIYLKFANALDMVTILEGVSASQAKLGATTSGPTTRTGADAPAEPEATLSRRRTASISDGTSTVDIQADEHTNALIITAPPGEMRNILAVVRQLDIRRAQVLVEAIIAEISDGKSRELGVSYAVKGDDNSGAIGFSNLGGGVDQAIAIKKETATTVGTGLTLALGSVGGGTDFGFIVRAIASDAANNILSTPSLVTLDNQEAEIIVGQNVPFVTGSTASDNNANPFTTIERQDVGLTLRVKPQINEGNTIKMEISQEVSSIGSSSEVTSDVVTNKRSINTTVLIESGQTLVLGGLIEDTVRDTQEKVPLLGDIPFIGRLFQYRSTVKAKQNLMVFLHPTILHDRETSDYYSKEKYTYLRSRQLAADEKGIGLLEDETPVLPEIEMLFAGSSIFFRIPSKLEPDAETSEVPSEPVVTVADGEVDVSAEPELTPGSGLSVAVGTVAVQVAPELDARQETTAVEPLPATESTTIQATESTTIPAAESIAATAEIAPEPEPAALRAVEQTGDGDMANIRKMRIGVGGDRTRIVLDVDQDVSERVERVFNPDGSVSITLAKTQLGSGFAMPDTEIDKVKLMVIDQRDDAVYIHIVPTDKARFTYQALAQNDTGNYRFLIDIRFENTLSESQDN